jgi:hypothetical protein
VVRFLSDEWIAAFDRAAARAPGLTVPPGTDDLIIQHMVTDVPRAVSPDGERAFHLRLSTGPARVLAGRADTPTVTFTQSYATAAAVATGQASAQAAFMAGELRLGGRVDRLLAHHAALAAVDDCFAELRDATEH